MKIADRIADLNSSRLSALEAYWLEKRGTRRMTARSDIDPTEIRDLLPHLIMTRIQHEPFRVRYSLVGTVVARNAGSDFTNLHLDEIGFLAEPDTDWPGIYRRIVTDGRPIAGTCHLFLQDRIARPYHVAVFPLSDDDTVVNGTIAIEDMSLNLVELDHLVLPVIKPSDADSKS
jgi:PAS domain